MPQNAIIRADGTGDYTTLAAWESAEQNSNYGSVTVGRVDGFFDQGGNQFIIGGSWVNGARLEAFNTSEAFNGVERQLCGMTSSSTYATLRTTIAKWEVDGLEVYNTSTGGSHRQTTVSATDVVVNNVLSKTVNGASALDVPPNVSTVTNSVLVGTRVFNNAINGVNVTLFANTTSSVGGSGTSSLTDSIIANASTGACYRASVTQSNNAATDATADAFDNIVVADNFINSDPVTSGDYRIASGSLLANNNIGAFIESSAGLELVLESGNISLMGQNVPVLKGYSTPIDSGILAVLGSEQLLNRDYAVSLDSGEVILEGTTKPLLKGLEINLESGVLSYNGKDVDLIYTPSTDTVLIVESGSLLLSGTEIPLTRDYLQNLETGITALEGDQLPLSRGYSDTNGTGDLRFLGNDLVFSRDYLTNTGQGGIDFSGRSLILVYSGAPVLPTIDGVTVKFNVFPISVSFLDSIVTTKFSQ